MAEYWYLAMLIRGIFGISAIILIFLAIICKKMAERRFNRNDYSGNWSAASITLGTFGLIALLGNVLFIMGPISGPIIGQYFVILGAMCNALVILVNGGFMPVYHKNTLAMFRRVDTLSSKLEINPHFATKFLQVKTLELRQSMKNPITPFHAPISPETRLRILADIFPTPIGMASLGDFIFTIGAVFIGVSLITQLIRFLIG